MRRVLVVHYATADAVERAGRLRELVFEARPYLSLGARGFRDIRANLPEVILIDLTRMPSYGKAMGVLLRDTKAFRMIPLVFVTGDPKKTAAVREALPDAFYAPWDKAGAAIERAIARPPKEPRAPRVALRSAPAKLGIQKTSRVAMIHTPDGFSLDGIVSSPAKDADIVLFFATSSSALARELPALARGLHKGCRLWVIWPKKASGVRSDLALPRIFEIAAAFDLAPSKICAVDETWSGTALGPRRRRS